ncbi:DUF1287 domain-containing protein [Pseudobacteroides cellulosolvens]|uniref:DUF1287 domain-containing protein n=1 Tax=Pseudobacteroides cellulosolvens ATCC 35603 = DSM 2933 TaxID=398512 RepID=A0A0L6JV34_9FIRM|nr:DUF1287 domain-containing protein [Pseudobacteroides cellulosolvens]KNY29594.1 protein of unknown function DUF1287 [Pseudobacteroides cellulosolvens ATCC 35603 = DSM 2933]
MNKAIFTLLIIFIFLLVNINSISREMISANQVEFNSSKTLLAADNTLNIAFSSIAVPPNTSSIIAVHLIANTSIPIKIPKILCKSDKDRDGINDLDDIIQGAKKDAKNKPVYRSKYYVGGYPPYNEGVCTDVIWRALKNAGYNLKQMIDKDIKAHRRDYFSSKRKSDPNIDFRRVSNLFVFFKKYSKNLTTKLKPYDIDNLREWQGGDIVTFKNPNHIAIVSNKRRPDGIPYLIHNGGPYTMEIDTLVTMMPGITGHFRFPKQ